MTNILDRYIFRSVLFSALAAAGICAFVLLVGNVMKDLLRLFVMHIIPLLMAAAVIEAYVTPQLLKLFL